MSDVWKTSRAAPERPDSNSVASRRGTKLLPFVPGDELAREQRERLEQMVDERTAKLRAAIEQLGREVSERHAAEAALRHSVEYQSTINGLLSLALKQAPLEALLQRALDMVLTLPALDEGSAGAIFVVERPGVLIRLLPEDWVLAEWEVRVLGGVADVLASIISRKRGETRRVELEEHLPLTLSDSQPQDSGMFEAVISGETSLTTAVEQFEGQVIREALDRCGANKSAAASMIGITRRMLRYKLGRSDKNADDVDSSDG